MKNLMPQFLIVIVAFIALTFLMSYTRPAADEAKQYMIITSKPIYKEGAKAEFENEVSQKMSEGWHPQGGLAPIGAVFYQAMVK